MPNCYIKYLGIQIVSSKMFFISNKQTMNLIKFMYNTLNCLNSLINKTSFKSLYHLLMYSRTPALIIPALEYY